MCIVSCWPSMEPTCWSNVRQLNKHYDCDTSANNDGSMHLALNCQCWANIALVSGYNDKGLSFGDYREFERI